MPWTTPTLRDVRKLVRDQIAGAVPGADASVPNSVLRVMSDANGGLSHQNLLYLDWLARQLLPDTAEAEWLDRHGVIWLSNLDGTRGRKVATFASGIATLTGTQGIAVPNGTHFLANNGVEYESTEEIVLGESGTDVQIRALDAGEAGNQVVGAPLALSQAIAGVDARATVASLSGGADSESDDDLRARVLERIQNPPMGGAAHDYVRWAKEVPGVTRAWCAPLEMGVGTVTVRFMMDELRAEDDGFPNPDDVATVAAYLDTKRPVAVKDFFVVAPIAEPIDYTISDLDLDDSTVRAAIEASVAAMIKSRAAPASAINGVMQDAVTIHREWVSAAILAAPGVTSFDLTMSDHVMPSAGHIAVPGTATFA